MSTSAPAGAAEFDHLLQSAQDGVFVVDRHRRYVLFNQACERLTGFASDDVVGRACDCGATTQCRDELGRPLWGVLCPAKPLFDGLADSTRQRMDISRADGSRIRVDAIYTAVRARSGNVEFVVAVIREVDSARAGQPRSAAESDDPAARMFKGGAVKLELDPILTSVERDAIQRALRAAHWQRNKAAELLGISRSRLYRRMEALGIDPDVHG